MPAKIIDGNEIARQIRAEVASDVKKLPVKPCLAVILVGDDPASHIYVQKKQEACKEVGIESRLYTLPYNTQRMDIIGNIYRYNNDDNIHAILVQLPLPSHINKFAVFDAINPEKDVDVFTPYNVGLLLQNRPHFMPCTPQAVREILVRSNIPIMGQHVVVINRSLVVGLPLAHMLMQNEEFANATVTVCHEYTKNIKEITRSADIIVTAVGQKDKFVLTGDFVKPGATVIDVAIVRNGRKISGDVDFTSVNEVAGHLAKVPGGVGPCTVAQLLKNTVKARNMFCEKLGKF